MEFPEIPTDNLYKFMALSGVVILVLSLIPFYHAHRLYLDALHLSGDIKICGIQLEWQSKDANELMQQLDTLTPQISNLWQKIVGLAQQTSNLEGQSIDLNKQIDELIETMPPETTVSLDSKIPSVESDKKITIKKKKEDIQKELDRDIQSKLKLEEEQHKLEEKNRELKEKNRELKEKNREFKEEIRKQQVTIIQHETKCKEHIYLSRIITIEMFFGIFGFLSGLALAIKGFRLWHLKLQVHQDRIIQMKAKSKD